MVTKWLNTFALKTNFFGKLHFGAIFSRCAVNVVVILTHNVKKAMQKQNMITALIFDIKAAFDNISQNKLIKQL